MKQKQIPPAFYLNVKTPDNPQAWAKKCWSCWGHWL